MPARSTRSHKVAARRRWKWPTRLVGLSLVMFAALLAAGDQPAAEESAPAAGKAVPAKPLPAREFKRAAIIRFDGEITPWLEGYFNRKLELAKNVGADLLVVEIDSPGGYMHESGEIARKLSTLSWARTVAYVPDQALSGAAYVSLGCDEIVMHPMAQLGDVGVIFLDSDFMFHYAPEKIRSHLAQELRTLAEMKGRPPALAEAMVDMDVEVFRFRNRESNEIKFLSLKEHAVRPDAGDWEQLELVLESQKGRFLEVSGKRALEVQLATAVVNDKDELKARYGVTDWIEYRPDNVDKAVYVLGLWYITALLFVVGMVGILYELCAPGTCIGGLTALSCFAIFFWSRFLCGTSGILELVLFGLGVIFLAVELFVLPGFGISGVTGILLIFVSLVLACQNFVIPRSGQDWNTLGTSMGLVLGSAVAFFVIAVGMTRYFHTIPVLSQMVLAPPTAASSSEAPAGAKGASASGKPAAVLAGALVIQVGTLGRAESPLRPIGRARFGNQFVDVVADGDFIPKGASIRVVDLADQRIVVEAAEEAVT